MTQLFLVFYYVYILQSQKDESLYIGFTSSLRKRVKEHNEEKNQATRSFKPYKLVYYEAFLNKQDAKRRKEYLKSGWGWRSIKQKLLVNYLAKS